MKDKKQIATLENLVKVAENKVENQQKKIAATEEDIAQTTAKMDELRSKIESGFNDSSQEIDMLDMASKYMQRAQGQIKDLEQRKKLTEMALDTLRDELKDLFAEQKRYELLLEQKQRERKKRLEKVQQEQLDDLSQRRQR